MAKKLFTKAKEILIGVYNEGEEDTGVDSVVALDYVVADSLSINPDDAEETTIDCETSDSPILDDYTQGDVKVDLNNASLDADFLQKVIGWVAIKNGEKTGYAAPKVYSTRYIALQIKFSASSYVYLPKIAISPKVVFESLKTNAAYGTLSGTALCAEITGWTDADGNPAESAITTIDSPILEKGKDTAENTGD